MLEHVCEEQPSHLLGHDIFLGGNEVCHLAKLIASNPLDGGKLTMKSMDTLSHALQESVMLITILLVFY